MTVVKTERHPVASDEEVVRLRRIVRQWSADLGLSLVDQTKLVTAASEIGRNTVVYGGGGMVDVSVVRSELGRPGIRLVFADRGPGIPSLELALRDGYTTGNGLGLGLGGAKRLVNEFDLASAPGQGTTVTLTRWK